MTVAKEPKEVVCSCCRDRRFTEEKPPRLRQPVWIEGFEHPVLLCEFCDGDALRYAKAHQEKQRESDK
jgi:hypothetical protein